MVTFRNVGLVGILAILTIPLASSQQLADGFAGLFSAAERANAEWLDADKTFEAEAKEFESAVSKSTEVCIRLDIVLGRLATAEALMKTRAARYTSYYASQIRGSGSDGATVETARASAQRDQEEATKLIATYSEVKKKKETDLHGQQDSPENSKIIADLKDAIKKLDDLIANENRRIKNDSETLNSAKKALADVEANKALAQDQQDLIASELRLWTSLYDGRGNRIRWQCPKVVQKRTPGPQPQ